MSKDQVTVLYKCVVCGRAYSSKQALRGHMNAHRGEGYSRTSVVVKKEDWKAFKIYCVDHKTTTCSLLGALIVATIKGGEQGLIRIGSENPAIIQVNQYFTGKPRGAGKLEVPSVVQTTPVCRLCGSSDVYEFTPEFTNLLQGRCRKCGVEWLIGPMP